MLQKGQYSGRLWPLWSACKFVKNKENMSTAVNLMFYIYFLFFIFLKKRENAINSCIWLYIQDSEVLSVVLIETGCSENAVPLWVFIVVSPRSFLLCQVVWTINNNYWISCFKSENLATLSLIYSDQIIFNYFDFFLNYASVFCHLNGHLKAPFLILVSY